jgi:hypothetical protein
MKRPSFPRFLLLVLLTLFVLAVVGEWLTSLWLEKKLRDLAEEKGLAVESIKVSLYRRAIRVYNFAWQPADSTSASIKLEKVTARGIGIIDLLSNHSISIRRLIIENGNLRIKAHHKSQKDSAHAPALSLRGLRVESFQLTNTMLVYSDSNTTWSGKVDLDLHHIKLKDPSKPARIASYEGSVRSIAIGEATMKPRHGYFSASVGKINFDHEKDLLSCDSIHIIPLYPKLELARVRGTQSTWVDVMLPHIEARGFDLNYHKDTTLAASYILIRDAHIEAFRDRRVPLKRRSEVPLPMKWLRELAIAIEIDTIEVARMDVTYEHISEDGFKPGQLNFANLNAKFRNVLNRSYHNTRPVTTMISSAEIMGGHIQGYFTFPLEPGVRYEARGKVRGLSLPRLNPMLENAAFVSIESGKLTELDFRFHYDNNVSEGEATVDYKDLKVKGLKKDRAGNENQAKTLVANAALKNNNKKTGAINNERDKQRFIFHYWATSVMSGIRDAVAPAAPESKKKR